MQIATTIIFVYCTSIVFADFHRTLQSINVWKGKLGNNLCYLPQQNGKTLFNRTSCVEQLLFPSRTAEIARTDALLAQINDQLNHLTEMMLLKVSVLDDVSQGGYIPLTPLEDIPLEGGKGDIPLEGGKGDIPPF